MENKSALETILARRSVRTYELRKLNKDTIEALLAYAVRAPTAMHQEPCAFVVIQDQSLLERISTIAKPLFEKRLLAKSGSSSRSLHDFSDPNYNIFYGADTLIVILAKLTGPFVDADCWLAAENLMLAATAMNLGTCVIGSAVDALNASSIKAKLNIPSEYRVIAPIIVGVASGVTAASQRKAPVVLSWMS